MKKTFNPAFGLSDETVSAINTVFSRYPQIRAVVLYGSRAKGNFRPGGDIDLTLKGEHLNLRILNAVGNELDDLLLPYTFDLSIFHHIENRELLSHINRVGKLFYKAGYISHESETLVLRDDD